MAVDKNGNGGSPFAHLLVENVKTLGVQLDAVRRDMATKDDIEAIQLSVAKNFDKLDLKANVKQFDDLEGRVLTLERSKLPTWAISGVIAIVGSILVVWATHALHLPIGP